MDPPAGCKAGLGCRAIPRVRVSRLPEVGIPGVEPGRGIEVRGHRIRHTVIGWLDVQDWQPLLFNCGSC